MRRGLAEWVGPSYLKGLAGGRVVRHALVRFAVLSLLSAVAVTLATLVVADRIAREKALNDARAQGVGIANRLAAPLVDEKLRAQIPGAEDQLATVMANRMRDGSVRHVKLWDETGRILWSDQEQIVGRTFVLDPEVAALFGTRGSVVELSDLEDPEHVAEQREGELLEVYVGTADDAGMPLVFEAYLSTQSMEENARDIVAAFVPLILGSLLLLLLLMLPLAVSLARRVERAQSERAIIMRHALLASDLERRRIAEDLHNGVVQELAGLGYALPTLTRYLEEGGDPGPARALAGRATEMVQDNVHALRSLMTDIYPPDLDVVGLGDAVRELVGAEARSAALEPDVEVEESLELSPDASRLAYRIVREGVHNVVKHARASRLSVRVAADDHEVTVAVLDDGRGPGERPGHSPRGHLGLRLLDDTVRDFGGWLDVRAVPEGGTLLSAGFPPTLEALTEESPRSWRKSQRLPGAW